MIEFLLWLFVALPAYCWIANKYDEWRFERFNRRYK